jgi:hypothetical protein
MLLSEKKAKRFQNFFNNAEGDWIIGQIDELAGYKDDTFNEDPYKHAYNTGMRSVSVKIHNILNLKLKGEEK